MGNRYSDIRNIRGVHPRISKAIQHLIVAEEPITWESLMNESMIPERKVKAYITRMEGMKILERVGRAHDGKVILQLINMRRMLREVRKYEWHYEHVYGEPLSKKSPIQQAAA